MTTIALVKQTKAVPQGDPAQWEHQCGTAVKPVDGQEGKYFCAKCLEMGEPEEWNG